VNGSCESATADPGWCYVTNAKGCAQAIIFPTGLAPPGRDGEPAVHRAEHQRRPARTDARRPNGPWRSPEACHAPRSFEVYGSERLRMATAKKTILVIDDEPHIVIGLRDALEFEGFRVISAGKGHEGVSLARSEAPDAVILDLMLPDLNGYAVCEELRRMEPVRAHRHAHGSVAGDGQDPRPRLGRRRLRHQAVQRERAHRPDARHLPPRRARCGERRPRR
jgi:CheY-like chemotaxis protein